ncbi:MAG: AAA family ATPase [Chloroflexi bacterium]|nr:AAA family ATPase [Chloroflexota bacterium]
MTLDPQFKASLARFIPADLMALLPDDDKAMSQAIRRLSSLQKSVSSFLPMYIADNEDLLTRDYGDFRPGTFMFSDVSGFTALSEKLQAAKGVEAVEILTEVINDYFATMLEIIAKSNGELLKFAGDALLVFFPDEKGESDVPAKAIRTGLRMQRAMMQKFQPIQHSVLAEMFGEDHGMELTMSVGISMGRLFEALVGNDIQRDHIIQGILPGMAMLAEEAGVRDDVIVDTGLFADYHNDFEMVPTQDEGFYQVVDNFGNALSDYEINAPKRRRGGVAGLLSFEDKDLLADLQKEYQKLAIVAKYVAPEIVNKLALTGDHVESENRPATVMFVNFNGFAELLEQWGAENLSLLVSVLDRYYGTMQRVVASNGGSLTRTDPFGRGTKMLITFGAPVAHPDDPVRAVATAMEMNWQLDRLNTRLLDELPKELHRWPFISQKMGIAQGFVYAGEAGWRARREYTVMGDDVNLAARLMKAAESGQVVISNRVYRRVNPHFQTVDLPPLKLKGKAQPVQAYSVQGVTARSADLPMTSTTKFVGRDVLMLTLSYALQTAKGPRRRRAFAFVGETGVGKTRIMQHYYQEAAAQGFFNAWATCSTRDNQHTTWGRLLSQLLRLDQLKSAREQHRFLRARLAEFNLMDVYVPLCDLFELPPDQEALNETIAVDPDDTMWMAIKDYQVRRATQDIPVAAPVNEETRPQAKQVKDIFALIAERKLDSTRSSGIFGDARDQAQNKVAQAAQSGDTMTSMFEVVDHKINISDAVVRFLQAFSNETPTLLVIDDLHSATPEAVTILRRVLEEIKKARLVIAVAYEPLKVIDLGLQPNEIKDFSRDEVIQMAQAILEADEIGSHLDEFLWERTKGRPLFVESLLQVLRDNKHIWRRTGKYELKKDAKLEMLPDDVRGLITSRIDRLTQESKELLRAAAVLGEGFSRQAVAAVAQMDNEQKLDALLKDLTEKQLIESQPDGTYHFKHGLGESTVYESLTRQQRLNLHRLAAKYYQEQGGDLTDALLIDIAYHLMKSGNPLRAMEIITTTAQQAEEVLDVERALSLYRRALDIFPNDKTLPLEIERLEQLG